ncbi:hypothetical protein SNOG_06465 [Parastagonospora nodorum SN15]|uniref:Uncharacterized protein n=1 Tax=Phaeosphaeria nodorum (strain SN15 / ATCC MYA-4574 / FGSC 10173) TaxID=321614 RepID=Q0UP49_PHANO|nr:hypothetical protein SNOG_06465 [Parastagonospora nodorum SN15]EAT86296.2 hypothetical protein SNOG_06465 [Parastagonospora nodorum SN15]
MVHGTFGKAFHQHFEHGIWVRYDLKGSQGPKYQLQFTHHNASSWAAKNPHQNGEWAFRIDDQAMIPAHLMDEEEQLYQRWFQKRYPEKNQIRMDQRYINDSFLGDPDQIKVPSDKQFHMAHCVRALRRYWQAKETGKHVCPRDIDYRHMKHCLDSMDEWAFPDGERGSIKPVVDSGTWKLIWETKILPILWNLLGEVGREIPFPWAGALHFFLEHFVEELLVVAVRWQPAEVYRVKDAALSFCFGGRWAAFGDDEGVAGVAFGV